MSNPQLIIPFSPVVAFIMRRKVQLRFRMFYYGFFYLTLGQQVFSSYNFYYQFYVQPGTIATPLIGWIVLCWFFSPAYFWIKDIVEKKGRMSYSEFDYYEIIYFLAYGCCLFLGVLRITLFIPGQTISNLREEDFIFMTCVDMLFTIIVTGLEKFIIYNN